MIRLSYFRHLLMALLTGLIAQFTYAQDGLMAGYLITLQGDTVRGQIDYRDWLTNPRHVFFRAQGEERSRGYDPMDIREFRVADELYVSAMVETEVSQRNTQQLAYGSALDMKKDTVFLQVMIEGPKRLCYYRNYLGIEQFYIWQDSAYRLLVYKRYLKDVDGETVIGENKTYVGQLILYLSDCEKIRGKLSTVAYQKNSLEDIFVAYYGCTHREMQFYKKTERVLTEFGVLAGASVTTLKFGGDDAFFYLIDAGFKPSVNFSAGVFLDVVFARSRGRWSISNTLLYSAYSVDGNYEDVINADKYTKYTTNLGFGYLNLVNMIRYRIPIGKMSLFLNLGISNGYAFSEKNEMKKETKLYDQVRVEELKALNDTRRYEFGYTGGFGATLKRFSLEIRYEYGYGVSPYVKLSSPTNRIFCFLGYRITK